MWQVQQDFLLIKRILGTISYFRDFFKHALSFILIAYPFLHDNSTLLHAVAKFLGPVTHFMQSV